MKLNFRILLAVICLLFLIVGCDDGNVDNSSFVDVKSETLTDPINSLYIEWNSGVINITKSESETITINERAKEDFLERNMFTYELNGSQLKILDPHYNHPVIMLEHDINISIPEQKYDEININGTSVQVNMDDFKATNLNLICNTTEHHISGEFNTVNSEFTSGDINYKFYNLPEKININGYVSEGRMILPVNSKFNLTQNLTDSNLRDEFELKQINENTYQTENAKSDITVTLNQSTFDIEKNE